MREILFRGKRKDNGEWVYGNLIKRLNYDELSVKYYAIQEITSASCHNFARVIPETIGQYTGLKDKNGNKIFEGDLIDFKEWQVAYCDGKGEFYGMQVGWYVQRDDWESYVALTYDVVWEVIGNIHDNPELLEDKQ